MGYQHQPKKAAAFMAEKAQQLLYRLNKPIVILRELFLELEQHRFIFPNYSTVQNSIGHAIAAEEKRLCAIIKQNVPINLAELLDNLLKTNDIGYEITTLKKLPKSFGYQHIQHEIQQHKKYYPLYQLAKIVLPQLEISKENITYYASLVIRVGGASQLRPLTPPYKRCRHTAVSVKH